MPTILIVEDLNEFKDILMRYAKSSDCIAVVQQKEPLVLQTIDGSSSPPSQHVLEDTIADLLIQHGIPPHRVGFRYLQKAIEFYLMYPKPNFQKVIYPKVAEAFGFKRSDRIEKGIRTVIASAWYERDPETWKIPCKYQPTNMYFIGAIAQMIRQLHLPELCNADTPGELAALSGAE